jgi:hypothetical protein
MKTKKWIFTIIAVTIITAGFATEKAKMIVSTVEDEIAFIAYNSDTPSNIELTIKDERGVTMYYYKSKQERNSYRGKFDFSKVETGDYHVYLKSNDASMSSRVRISPEGIEISPAVKMPEPVFNLHNHRLDVSFLNVPQEQVYLNLYKKGEHVSSISLGAGMCIQKRILLSNLKKGEYKVVLNDLFKEHIYMVSM